MCAEVPLHTTSLFTTNAKDKIYANEKQLCFTNKNPLFSEALLMQFSMRSSYAIFVSVVAMNPSCAHIIKWLAALRAQVQHPDGSCLLLFLSLLSNNPPQPLEVWKMCLGLFYSFSCSLPASMSSRTRGPPFCPPNFPAS